MKDARMFIVFWFVNSTVFYFASLVLSGLVVTGNARLAPFMASIVSGFLLTVADAVTAPVFESLKIKLKDEWQWALAYLFVNVLGVWVIARYADLTGVGVATAWVAVVIGIICNIGQWVGWKLTAKTKKIK